MSHRHCRSKSPEPQKSNSESTLPHSTSDDIPSDFVYELDLDRFINRLTSTPRNPPLQCWIDQEECFALCYIIRNVFQNEPMLLELDAPLKVCGDIHGQFPDLLRLIDLCGTPPNVKYLFLGDYVDRGIFSLEVICFLFAIKLKYPKHVFLLRGNHESQIINQVYGFKTDIKNRYNSTKVWRAFSHTFNVMPVIAIIEGAIYCCHGGISPDFMKPKYSQLADLVSDLFRPCEVPKQGPLCDILWSDPISSKHLCQRGWLPNDRGCSYAYGEDVIEKFLDKFDLDLIVRAHQVVPDGYEFYAGRKLVTIFSAPNYCGEFDNAGAIFCLKKRKMVVDRSSSSNPPQTALEGSFQIVKPDPDVKNIWHLNLRKSKRKLKNMVTR